MCSFSLIPFVLLHNPGLSYGFKYVMITLLSLPTHIVNRALTRGLNSITLKQSTQLCGEHYHYTFLSQLLQFYQPYVE